MPESKFTIAVVSLLLGVLSLIAAYYRYRESMPVIRIVIGLLWIGLAMGGLGYVVAGIQSLEIAVVLTALVMLVLGVAFLLLAPAVFPGFRREDLLQVLLYGIPLYSAGVAGFFLVYPPVSTAAPRYYLCATSGFILAVLLLKSYDLWMSIPRLKYKAWVYPLHQEVPRLLPIDPVRLRLNFTPVPGEGGHEFDGYEVEFPTNVPLSELFHYFISFHNKHREYRKKPVQYMIDDQPLSWMFYTLTTGNRKNYLDFDKTLPENGVHMGQQIYAVSFKQD